ncbi:ChbG/HpnK family deacetylase [bacterium]|nr:ChbG/HpnK family deacetylase [bacterium]
MINKKFILNADDFGLTQYHNQAVLEGYNNGFLTSASLCANGYAYENAVHDILPDCPNLGIAAHLNIMEGKSLTDCPLLTDTEGNFNKGYGYLILNQKRHSLLLQIEAEFKAQIEKIQKDVKIDHLDSHVHTHAIPEIFKITCKLAKEYGIKYVRTQFEELYFIPKLEKHLNISYPINLIKIALLQYYTKKNRKVIDEFELKTNDFIIGVGYTGMMDSDAIEYGLKALDEDCIAEALIHPCKYNNSTKDSHTREFAITQNLTLKDTITRLGFDITNYKNLE